MRPVPNFRLLLSFVLLFCFSFALVSCGGGGGSSSSSGSLAYTGVDSHALITEVNAAELASSALSAGAVSSTVSSPMLAVSTAEPIVYILPNRLLILKSVMSTIEDLDVRNYQYTSIPNAVSSESETFNGDCGGYFVVSIKYEDTMGYFDGNIKFYDFCENGEEINGTVYFTGLLDMGSGNFINFTMNIEELEENYYSESYVMSGTVEVDVISDSTVEMEMNVLVKDSNLDRIFKLYEYVYTLEESYDEYAFQISGRFYHPDYGYVDLSTPVSFQVGLYDEYPYSGQLLLRGGDSTSALLTAHNTEECEISADLNGDGSYEMTSGIISWMSL